MDSLNVPRKLWEHSNPSGTEMYRLMQEINQKHHLSLKTFWELYQYSTTNRAQFWDQAFQFLDFVYSGSYTKVVDESVRIDSVPRWFDGVHLNFAENLLYSRIPGEPTSKRGTIGKEDNKIALTEIREGYTEVRDVSWGQLRREVGVLASAMKSHGVKKGDRVVVVASNSVDTLKVWLAVTTLGGLFSSSSTDMGVQGVLQRALQVSPKYIFMDDFTVYNGKKVDLRSKMTEIANGMKDVAEFEGMVSMPRFQQPVDISKVPRTQTLATYLSKAASQIPEFERTAFHDPFFIAYSSGTTGTPKCIVHSIGGALLSSAKEGKLHREMNADSVALQYTTTGWIMYYASVANLLAGSRVVLYDGSPFQPDLTTFVRIIGEQKVTMLGTSPRWMHEMQKNKIIPKEVTDLSHLKSVTSTGMVLSDQLFEWFYDVGFPKHVHLANISGGTDLAGCFGQENPLTPVYVGGTQGPSLGTPVAVYDSLVEGGKGISGALVDHGTPGELVAPAAFPNMPVYFWNDSDGSRYFSAYFEKYDNVWTHGDFVMIHPTTKALVFLGRADGVLNPSGVRFGSAEIYSVIEDKFPGIADSICVGQRRPQDTDESVMLFLMMKPDEKFSSRLVNEVKSAIRKELSARHVPKHVFETPEIPTTVNLKKVELPVKQIVSGKIIKPSGTLLNPKSLDYYYQFAKVEELVGSKSKL
ncbi:acetoacetyl-CoA synthetase-like protein [Mollisia scopiformis]|uniref:Acetoacetyl-CoA synthetase-like protein n=1 Tax=Mollisia scopiformis TaxID=149040 RepID=A0A132B2W2_MOLSC|nr:acetoacetyl-CoA synthetase-like protein [Mollisia scopiformis]KUJ06748.1 acetoacetyl-CoA synthetase-like protein [Mollisia scopiformis]